MPHLTPKMYTQIKVFRRACIFLHPPEPCICENGKMAEIKSTLDMVMERTRHLTMSDRDRQEQAEAEFAAAVNRLAQKYLDGEIEIERFQDDFDRIEANPSVSKKRIAAAEVGKRIELSGDNRRLFDLLKSGLRMDISGIETVLKEFREAMDTEEQNSIGTMLESLRERGISGSAVLPNPEADEDGLKRRDEIFREFEEELKSQIARPA